MSSPNSASNSALENGISKEKETATTQVTSPSHELGLMGWLYILAGFLTFLTAWGSTTGVGAFQDYYQRTLLSSYTPSAISWIGTVNATFLISIGTLAGPLFDRGYVKELMLLGSVLVVFGQMMLSLSTKYYQIMLTQGFCIGIGSGLIYVPTIAMITTQFTSKRAIAMGFITSGGSIGGVIFPMVFVRLQPKIGFPWTVRVLAFIQLACCFIALPIIFLKLSMPKKSPRNLIHWSALKESTFSAYCIANFLLFMANFIPLFYVPFFAIQALGTSIELGFGLLALLNASSAIARIGSSLLSKKFGSSRLLLVAVFVSSVMLFGWIGVHNLGGFVVFCVLFGLFSGVLVSANPIVISHPVVSPTTHVYGTRLGMQWFATSIGVLVGAPIAGALAADGTLGSFQKLASFSGAVMAGGTLFLLWPLISIWKHDKKNL